MFVGMIKSTSLKASLLSATTWRKLVVVAPLLLSACVGLGDLAADGTLAPSANPIIAQNVRSGRLARIGAAQHPRIISAYGGEYSNVAVERTVASIVGKLVTVSDNPSQVYQITILDSPVVNAFALPGGYLYVSRGLLALANDSAEVAAVIAHEMGHVTANHGVLRQKKEAEEVLARRVVTDVLRDKEAGKRALTRRRVELAQFSRNQELEADAIGIQSIGEAGFDPYAAADFQTRMSEYNAYRSEWGKNDVGMDFLSSHPSTPQRVALAEAHARKFGARGDGYRGHDEYLRGIDGMLFGDDVDEGYVRGQNYSHVRLGITLTFPEGFDVENKADAVLAGRSDGAAVRFDGADVPKTTDLTEYMASGWVEGLFISTIRAIKVNGLDAASARASIDKWDFDVTAVRANGSVYRILTAVPKGSPDLSVIADQVRNSFRLLSSAEKSELKPLKVKIVTASKSDTLGALVAKMGDVKDPQRLFMTLNGLESGAEIRAGALYKTISQ